MLAFLRDSKLDIRVDDYYGFGKMIEQLFYDGYYFLVICFIFLLFLSLHLEVKNVFGLFVFPTNT